MPASMAGCRLAIGVPLPGVFDEPGLAAAVVLEGLFFDDELLLDDVLDNGTAILLAALGVGAVVHCHSPSALTQA